MASDGADIASQFASAVRAHQAGDLENAARVYSAILAQAPSHADALRLLGVLRHQRGDSAAGEPLIRQAIAVAPDNGKAFDNLALVLHELGRKGEARAALERAVALNPQSEGSHFSLGNVLAELGEAQAAIAHYRQALAINPRNAVAHLALAGLLLKARDAAAALHHVDASLAIQPADATALSYRAIALSEIGDRAGLDHLVDLDRFIRPAHVGDEIHAMKLADFNAALAAHIASHHTLRQVGTTVNGLDTQELLNSGHPLCTALKAFVCEQIDHYMKTLPPDPQHPLTAGRPQRYTLESWGVVMWSQGYQVAHIHKKAWISGVYYVQLPEVISADRAGNDGWIEFGHGPTELYGTSTPPTRRIRPIEGMLLTFPSYLWHRTIPFDADKRRICISFDLVPAA